jgi:hypothetical protein
MAARETRVRMAVHHGALLIHFFPGVLSTIVVDVFVCDVLLVAGWLAFERLHLRPVRKGFRDRRHEGIRRAYTTEGARAWHRHAHPPEGTHLDPKSTIGGRVCLTISRSGAAPTMLITLSRQLQVAFRQPQRWVRVSPKPSLRRVGYDVMTPRRCRRRCSERRT